MPATAAEKLNAAEREFVEACRAADTKACPFLETLQEHRMLSENICRAWREVKRAACPEKLEARDKAVALRVLTDIRDAANAALKGKGLSMSPAEAIANAWQAAFDKYQETAATLTDLQGLDPYE